MLNGLGPILNGFFNGVAPSGSPTAIGLNAIGINAGSVSKLLIFLTILTGIWLFLKFKN